MGEVKGITSDDGAVVIKDGETEVRYVKESDLLTIKGSREALQRQVDAALEEKLGIDKEAQTRVAEANTAKLKAEADVERLTEQIAKSTGTAEELARAKAELVTAQEAGKSTSTALLELRRSFITTTYKVNPETVKSKSLEELSVFESALKEVIGSGAGNYAAGGGGGGGAVPSGSPLELAVAAYAGSNKSK